MKRYLLTILLAVFALAGVGTYYVHGMLHPLPEYRVEPVEGDGSFISSLKVAGNLYRENANRAYHLEISTEGSAYDVERSLFSRRQTVPLEAELDSRHHSFLRGKHAALVNYYLDDDWLIYADLYSRRISDKEWEIAVNVEMLDLESGEKTEFTRVLESRDRDRWPYLADVQRIGDEIRLFASVSGTYRVYVLGTDGELLRTVNATPDLPDVAEEDGQREISLLSNHRPHAPKDVVGIQVITFEESGVGQLDLYLFDYREEKIRPFATIVPEQEAEWRHAYQDHMTDEALYLAWKKETELQIDRIGLADTVRQTRVIPVEQMDGNRVLNVTLSEGKAHVLAELRREDETARNFMVSVVDLKSGAILAKGKVDAASVGGSPFEELYVHGFIVP